MAIEIANQKNNLLFILLGFFLYVNKPRKMLAINWIADKVSFIAPSHLHTKFPSYKLNSPEDEKIKNTEKFLIFALKQKKKYGSFTAPKNRKVVYDHNRFP